jgi:hypothetical protein
VRPEYIASLVDESRRRHGIDPTNPWARLSYTEFVARIGVTLTPAQYVLARVAFDSVDPVDLQQDERAIAREMFGDVERFDSAARRVLVAVCGGRGGKSFTMVALRLLHLAMTVQLHKLASGEVGSALIVARDTRLSKQSHRYVRGAIMGNDELAKLVRGDTTESIIVHRADFERDVAIEVLPATAGGGAVRARSLVGAALDECAFFRDDNYSVNDVEIFRAIRPRVLTGGQVILASTPYAETGLLYEEFRRNHPDPGRACSVAVPGKPTTAIAAHAPTMLLRDGDAEVAEIIRIEEMSDPLNAEREYGAKFMTAGTGLFFNAKAIASSIKPVALPVKWTDEPHVRSFGGDFAFVRDSAAGVLVERTAERIRIVDFFELVPEGSPLKPSEVFAHFADEAARHDIAEVVGDQHYAESAREGLWKKRVAYLDTPAGQSGKAVMFTAVRLAMNEGRIDLPDNPKLLQQLREVQSKPTPGGGISITQPRKPSGGHGDIVSAFVAAAWNAERQELPEAPDHLPADPLGREAELWQRGAIERAERSDRARRDDPLGIGLDPPDFGPEPDMEWR